MISTIDVVVIGGGDTSADCVRTARRLQVQRGLTDGEVMDYYRGAEAKRDEDIAILKNFHVDEKKYFEFRASAFNALNRHLLPGPNTNMDSANFGMITDPQGNSPRQIQLGLKFYF